MTMNGGGGGKKRGDNVFVTRYADASFVQFATTQSNAYMAPPAKHVHLPQKKQVGRLSSLPTRMQQHLHEINLQKEMRLQRAASKSPPKRRHRRRQFLLPPMANSIGGGEGRRGEEFNNTGSKLSFQEQLAIFEARRQTI